MPSTQVCRDCGNVFPYSLDRDRCYSCVPDDATYYEIVLEACEPEELFDAPEVMQGAVEVFVLDVDPRRSSGCPDVCVSSADRDALLAFVLDQWGGSGDTQWEAEIPSRITEVSQ